MTSAAITEALLPLPREVTIGEGYCAIPRPLRPCAPLPDPRLEVSLGEWERTLAPPSTTRKNDSASSPLVRIVVHRAVGTHEDAYVLHVRPDAIELIGQSPRGCFHGLQTLRQLPITARGIPCCRIKDHPDFQTRGLLLDITRGKVPKLDTLKLIADRLALLKANQLQLYIEHAFTFAFDPEIADADHGLTPDEVGELDGYCRDRFIDLVPAVATLGHMGRILSMPRYRHLAEIEPTKPWSEMSWPDRARGFTLDVSNPESHRLVERIWADILEAFSSPVVNICGDEPWDLGKGKNKDRFGQAGGSLPYVEHILRTHRFCSARARRTQVWSDAIRNHPELFDRLPQDLTVLHWGYGDNADYEGTRAFTDKGLNTLVCPGTSGWKRIINAMDLAERNISTFAAAARRHGACGLINTDWGDHGHFNLLACSWHGIALGAALAWRADHPLAKDFDRRFAQQLWNVADHHGVELLRQASGIAEHCETWRMLWQPLPVAREDPTLPATEQAVESAHAAGRFLDSPHPTSDASPEAIADRSELETACRFVELFADRIATARSHHARCHTNEPSWRGRISDLASAYASCWLARNKPSGLPDVLRTLRGIAET